MILGQLEKTLLESFCSASRIKSFAHRAHSSPALKHCSELLNQCLGTDLRGTLNTDINRFFPSETLRPHDPTVSLLDREIVVSLRRNANSLSRELPGWVVSEYATILNRLQVRGVVFSSYSTHIRNSIVFYFPLSGGQSRPGIIREIFTTYSPGNRSHTFFAIHPYHHIPSANHVAIFNEWTDFGAELFSTKYGSDLDIIPVSHTVHHAIRRIWRQDSQVLKSLDRVRPPLS